MTNDKSSLPRVTDVYESVRRNLPLVACVFVVMLLASAAYVRLAPRQYLAGANVLVVNGNTRDDPTLSSPDLPSIATSTVVLERVRQDLHLNTTLQDLKRHVTAKPPPFKSSILRIQYVDTDGARAAQIANAVADELTRYYREISKARFDEDLTGLNVELAKQNERIKTIDRLVGPSGRAILDSSDAKSVNLDTGGVNAVPQTNSPERDRKLAEATLQGDLAHLDAVRADAAASAQPSRRDVLQNDRLYQNLVAAATSEETTLERDRAVYRDSYPGMAALEAKVANLKAAAAAEERRALESPDVESPSFAAAQSEVRKAEAVVAADRARVAAFSADAGKNVPPGTSLATLRLERDAAKENYLAISSRIATALANRADALSLGSVVVVDRAIDSETQIGLGRRTLSLILAFLIVVVSIGSALLADRLNPRLRRVAQIETLYGKPVIATLGNAK